MVKTILWDFDGVILNSMPVREYGFKSIFSQYSEDKVKQLLDFHNKNGGLSRFVKIKYFYDEIIQKELTDAKLSELVEAYSSIMKEHLADKQLIIKETYSFIEKSYKDLNFHVVSGSENNELNHLCKQLNLAQYFLSIHGSPTPKTKLVADLLEKHGYKESETILIGDSINDYDAAKANGIAFYGFNNEQLKSKSDFYIEHYDTNLESQIKS